MVRHELAAMVWGGLFFFVVSLLFLLSWGNILLLARKLEHHGDFCFFPNDASGGTAGEAAFVSWVLPFQPRVLPGFSLSLGRWGCSPLGNNRRGELLFKVVPPAGTLSGRTEVFLPRRGLYEGPSTVFFISDPFSLFTWRLSLGRQTEWFSLPPQKQLPARLTLPRSGGEQHQPLGRPQRQEDLLEVRPYFPGDDPRRIHWKMLSHTGDLFLRVGEESPPPRGRCVLVVDPSGGELSSQERIRTADLAAGYVRSLVVAARQEGLEMIITFPSGAVCSSSGGEWERETALMDGSPSAEPFVVSPGKEPLFYLTTPWGRGIPQGLPRYSRILWVNPWGAVPSGSPREGLFHLLFRSSGAAESGLLFGRGQVRRREGEEALEWTRQRGYAHVLLV